MCLMKPVQTSDETLYEVENDYDNLISDHDADWGQDRRDFGFTDDDIKNVTTWIDQRKKENILLESSQDMEPPTNLNKQQMDAFAIIKHFIDCKNLNKSEVQQLLLQINGPAGSGKSYWIQKVKGYAKKVFNRNNFVLTAAPSGTAAFLIKGETLHSLLMLPINYYTYTSLNDDSVRLYELQEKFKDVGILIIDEKSMIGQKLFHMVDMRLREIYPHRREQVFGGLSVVIIGDWKQLPPVGDSPLFNNSKFAKGYNLYSKFTDVINFSEIERQTGALQEHFREELGRLAEGNFSEQDWKKWKLRTLDILPPTEQEEFNQNAILACSEKKNMIQHNLNKVKSNNQPIAMIHAKSSCAAAKTTSSDKACGLLSELVVNKGSVVRLTANLWTKAGLTNGAKGIVKGIIYAPNTKPPALPICLIVAFDKYYGPSFIESIPNSVPICPVRREWYSQKKLLSRSMVPLILGYALSIHKLQGETLDKVILNIGDREFQAGLSLVGASRVRSFEGLSFSPFPNYDRFQQISKSDALIKRMEEEKRLKILYQKTLTKYHDIIKHSSNLYKL